MYSCQREKYYFLKRVLAEDILHFHNDCDYIMHRARKT